MRKGIDIIKQLKEAKFEIEFSKGEVDGVIGADILTSNKGIIDYANLTLYLKK